MGRDRFSKRSVASLNLDLTCNTSRLHAYHIAHAPATLTPGDLHDKGDFDEHQTPVRKLDHEDSLPSASQRAIADVGCRDGGRSPRATIC
jgi:hypothetical protein